MSTTVEGIVKLYPQMETGQGQNGPWYKQKMVIETYGQYPKTVAITFFGADNINALAQFPVGTPVKVSLNLESREYQGKWYDNINGWKVEHGSATAAPVAGYVQPAAPPAPAPQQPAPQNLQAQVNHAQQNYQVQPIWDGYKWVHPHTGQPMNPPAPVQPQAQQAPQQPAPAQQQPPQPQFQPQPAASQAPIPAAQPAPQNVGQPINSQAWNTEGLPF